MNIMMNKYLVEINDNLTEKETKILNYFYLPLIGSRAFSLYFFLIAENSFMNKSESNQMPIEKLENFLHLTAQEIQTELNILEKYQLLKIYTQAKQSLSFFALKKPLSVTDFFSNKFFYSALIKIVSNTWIEKAYMKFKNISFVAKNPEFMNNSKGIDEIEQKPSSKPEKSIFKRFPNSEFPNFVWKKTEKKMIEIIYQNFNISNNNLLVVLNYILRRNNGERIGEKYLLSIIEDLNNKNILQNEKKIKLHFAFIEKFLKPCANLTNSINKDVENKDISLKFPALFK